MGINYKLVLKSTSKEIFLKYQDNARLLSLCLASDNVFFSYFYSKNGHNRRKSSHKKNVYTCSEDYL